MRFQSVLLAVLGGLCVIAAAPPASAAVDFAKEIEPILIKRCSECHGPDKQKADLRLDSRAAALKAAKSGKFALVPGKAAERRRWQQGCSTQRLLPSP